MKKLLITSMAAVAVSICAKATETYTYNTTESFENYNGVENYEGPLFGTQEENPEAYEVTAGWVTTATPEDGIFTVTNIANYVGAGTHGTVSRPIDATPNTKALAIDTSNPLMRTVYTNKTATNYLEQAVFFDSVVQFTATDSKPTPGNDDKLMVWLYASDDVGNDNPGVFGETTPTTNLVITAGYYESIGENQTELVVTNYLTGVAIEPDSWHRLTIKAFKDNLENVFFNVWVDGDKVVVDGVTDFSSLLGLESTLNLTGVAFDGKGAVDDLVFTTTAPEFAEGGGEPEAENFTLKFTIDAAEEADAVVLNVVADGTDYDATEDGFILGVDVSSVVAQIYCAPGYKVTGAEEGEDDLWILPVDVTSAVAGGEITCNVTVVEDSGSGDDTEKPMVGGNTYGNGVDLTAAVKSDMTITVPSGWSVEGKVLKDAKGDTFATFAPYYILTQDGLTVAVTLDQKAAAPFAEATDLGEGEEVLELDETIGEEGSQVPAVGVRIKTYSGLWYGLGTATELGSWNEPTDWENGTGDVIQLKAAKQGDTRFYKIVVTDINPTPAE